MSKAFNKGIGLITIGFIVFILLLASAFGAFYQVDQGERGVVLLNGKIKNIAEPGLGFKMPIFESLRYISVRDHNVQIMLEAYSYDQQPARMMVSVTYRVPVDRITDLYSEYGNINTLTARVIERRTPDAVKNVFGQFTAVRAIQERQKLGLDTTESVKLAMRDAPVQIVGVQMEEVSFSDAYEKSIEQRMLAQVQIETTRQQKQTAEVQAEIKVVQAKAEADAQREQYQAQADGIRMRGEAEAAAILARGEALAANSSLVDLIAAEKWDGALPSTQVPNSALPFIGVK